MSTAAAPPPASTAEALAMLTTALGYLAAADPTQMSASEQAGFLAGFEDADAVSTAAHARVLGAFTAAQGHLADGDYSPKSWLMHQTRITRGAAAEHTAWARRARAHPRILAAMATRQVSTSYARTLCGWTAKLPEDCRDAADAILVAAAVQGMDLRDLAALAAEIQSRACPDPDPDDPGRSFEDRAVRLETTFQGAGVLSGDLTPECAALVGAVLDALSAPRGAEDDRSRAQRYHDGLQEAMNRLLASGLLPDRAGQPVKALGHITLADLIVLDADSALQDQWIERVRGQWAAHRAAASVAGSDGAAWLQGKEAEGFACDAPVTPIVFGEVNPAVIDDLVGLCIQLAAYHGRRDPGIPAPADSPAPAFAGRLGPENLSGSEDLTSGSGVPDGLAGFSDSIKAALLSPPVWLTALPGTAPVPAGLRSREALEREIIRKAVALVSGPGGLASFLRRTQLGARLAGPSLPLDVGYADTVPAAIRTAVKARDRFCQWAGGCHQPAAACEVHHLRHKGRGGETSLENCILLCWFHHHVMIHRMGWTLVRHPDGTTMAWNRDKTKVLRSHGPPARAG